jgi:tRNA threonylcarbamoyl adenosine modification protein YeaZ
MKTNKNTSLNKKPRLILGIDTSQAATVIGVNETLQLWISKRNQTNELLPKIDKLLIKLGIKPIQLDGVVVVTGPGSFTGLRVGVTVANGFGYGLRLPVLGLGKFDILTKRFPKAEVIILDAGRGELFVKFGKTKPTLLPVEKLQRKISSGATVAVDANLVPALQKPLNKAGTIFLFNLQPKGWLELALTNPRLPKKFKQVIPEYLRGANITKPKRRPQA